MSYYRRLKDLREDNDLTQQQVADYLMCNRQVYARYERGLREIPVSMLIRLAEFYNTSVDYLLGRTNNKEPIK
ncbi:MAG: helix-turn-helix transcriptional regulator [Clostridia bacterium]|nr:helix-turn-helix transcriptional regulator [Clostridia bacterium]